MWAPVGPQLGPVGPRLGPTGAHLGMLLGFLMVDLHLNHSVSPVFLVSNVRVLYSTLPSIVRLVDLLSQPCEAIWLCLAYYLLSRFIILTLFNSNLGEVDSLLLTLLNVYRMKMLKIS